MYTLLLDIYTFIDFQFFESHEFFQSSQNGEIHEKLRVGTEIKFRVFTVYQQMIRIFLKIYPKSPKNIAISNFLPAKKFHAHVYFIPTRLIIFGNFALVHV